MIEKKVSPAQGNKWKYLNDVRAEGFEEQKNKREFIINNLSTVLMHDLSQRIVILLWPVRGQRENTEEEKLDGTNVLKNRTYIQNKSVSTAGRSVRPKTVKFDC